METKLTLAIALAPPLPYRKFLFVCDQRSVKDLKSEIQRRLATIIRAPVTLTHGGFELMDDDPVADLLSDRALLTVYLQEHISSFYMQQETLCPRCSNKVSRHISKKEHGTAPSTPPKRKVYPAERVYSKAKPLNSPTNDGIPGGEDSMMERASTCGSSDFEVCPICDCERRPDAEHICFEEGSSGSEDQKIAKALTVKQILTLPDSDFHSAHAGSTIAYKALVIASNGAPAVSSYRIGKVVNRDDNGSTMLVRVLREFTPGETKAANSKNSRSRAPSNANKAKLKDGNVATDLLTPEDVYSFKLVK
ncbi:hypothetical protein BX070DRAFT_227796 [Coemansia spiralis]|nr:hypothetical protein BX070DRAFT_227796 [Coemansia spiralis]